MAQLLIKAKRMWMDDWSESKKNSLSVQEKKEFDRRITKGDVICIRPDDWVWGRKETLPNFVVIKLPGVTVEEANKYVESHYEDENDIDTIVYNRKFSIPVHVIDDMITKNEVERVMTKQSVEGVIEDKTKRQAIRIKK